MFTGHINQRSKPTKWQDSIAIITSDKDYLNIATGQNTSAVKVLTTSLTTWVWFLDPTLGRNDFQNLFSYLHTCTMAPMYTYSICVNTPHKQIHVKIKKCLRWLSLWKFWNGLKNSESLLWPHIKARTSFPTTKQPPGRGNKAQPRIKQWIVKP